MELPARCGRQTCIVNLFLTIALTLVLSADAVPNLVGWLQGKEVEKREPRPEWSTPSPIHSRGLGVVDPTRLEILSWKPRLEVYHGFLSSEECDHLVDMGKRRLMRSGVVDTNTGKSALSDIRTSSGTFLAKAQDGIVEAIEHRIAVWSHVPMENGEGIQLLRYQKGEKYDPHFDYFHHEGADHNGGNRLATVLMYLSDVEEGGETVFPNTEVPKGRTGQWSDCAQAGLAYKPVKGDAILFWSLTPYGDLDRYSMHGSCPVIVGEKWSATKWMHVGSLSSGLTIPKHIIYQEPPEDLGPGCHNEVPDCGWWAKSGECKANPGFMIGTPTFPGKCRPACNACPAEEPAITLR